MKSMGVFMRAIALVLAFVSTAAFADTVLICRSYQKIEGWRAYNTNDYLRFTAYVVSDTELKKAEVDGAYGSDVRDIKADPKYKPTSKRYANYNRFSDLEDAWNWFLPLLPKDLTSQKGDFRGYIQIFGEEGFSETVSLKCSLKDQ